MSIVLVIVNVKNKKRRLTFATAALLDFEHAIAVVVNVEISRRLCTNIVVAIVVAIVVVVVVEQIERARVAAHQRIVTHKTASRFRRRRTIFLVVVVIVVVIVVIVVVQVSLIVVVVVIRIAVYEVRERAPTYVCRNAR